MAKEHKFNSIFDKDVEAVLKQNMSHIKPVTNVSKDTDGGKKIFPFWSPVGSDIPEVFTDVEAYLKKPRKESFSKTAVDQMNELRKGAEKTKKNAIWADNSVMGSIKNWADATKGVNTKNSLVGIVKPLKNDLTATAGAKPITELDATKYVEPTVEKSAKAPKAAVGVVKPEADKSLAKTATTKQVIKTDTTKYVEPTVEKAAKAPKPVVGVVKPEADKSLAKTATTKQITKNDTTTKQVVKVEKAAVAPKPAVGVVKPKIADSLKKTATSLDKLMK